MASIVHKSLPAVYQSVYPTGGFNTTTVKWDADYGPDYIAPHAFNPTASLTGSFTEAVWLMPAAVTHRHKVSVDYGLPIIPGQIYIENMHHLGNSQGHTPRGIETLQVFGSNSIDAFTNTDPNDVTDLTPLGLLTLREHIASDVQDPQYFPLSNGVSYRYITFITLEAIQANLTDFIGIRRIEVQVVTHYKIPQGNQVIFRGNSGYTPPVGNNIQFA